MTHGGELLFEGLNRIVKEAREDYYSMQRMFVEKCIEANQLRAALEAMTAERNEILQSMGNDQR